MQTYDEFANEVFGPIFPLYAVKIIERTGKRDGELLDLGCGGGHLGFALMDAGSFDHVTFFDKNPDQLERARARADRRGYTVADCTYEEGDACDLSRFSANSFDLVVSRGSMQFWDDKVMALREIFRVLRHGGHAYLGGGIGVNLRQTRRVEALMERAAREGAFQHGKRGKGGGEPRGDGKGEGEELLRRRGGFAREFLDFCDECGCSYAIINSRGEGGWYTFCKDGGC